MALPSEGKDIEMPNKTLDALIASRLSGPQFRVLFVVILESWGRSKNVASIPLLEFEIKTGLPKTAISQALADLLQQRIIARSGAWRWSFNEDSKSWWTKE